ncbi:hypothetical protein [Bosea sp. (in: a-proteobacteria)]|uniref:hypothetical protein n=1 Tax=Bosea sp. (in: a-proteobacteria) TaxID=1871050 RepID=UPI002FCA2DE1
MERAAQAALLEVRSGGGKSKTALKSPTAPCGAAVKVDRIANNIPRVAKGGNMQKNISAIFYDLPTVSRFFRSCALVIAAQQSLRIEWETYRDSKVLNAIYTVFFWKEPPGMAVVKDGAPEKVERLTNELHERYLLAWVRKLSEEGPGAAQGYVTNMGHLRDMARKDTQNFYRNASNINSDVIRETQDGINNLATIKLGAQIGVAAIGAVVGIGFVAPALVGGTLTAAGSLTIFGVKAGATAAGFAIAGAAHSITHSVIKNWDAGANAQVVGIATEASKAGSSEVAGRVAGRVLDNALAGKETAQSAIRSAEGEIQKQSARLAQQGVTRKASAKAARRVADNTTRVAARTAELAKHNSRAVGATAVGVAIPVVFAAWDVLDAYSDYRETTAANR